MTEPCVTRILVGAIVIAVAGAAVAQPIPTTDPSRRPSSASPPPAPATPPAPVAAPVRFIKLGADGQPIEPPAEAAGGFYYDDYSGQTYEEPQTLRIGPTPDLHVVRSGDTLWDISWYYFNDPWQWPRVWSYNAQITNPHWIYPGDLVRLIPRGQFITEPEPPEGGGATQPTDPVPAPVRRTGVSLRQTAFVEQSELDTAMRIDGSVDDKQMLATGDVVFISYPSGRPPKVRRSYSVYVADNEVPGHGAYVKLLGKVEITDVKKDKRARGIITDSVAEIERGALVGAFIEDFKTVPPVPAKVDRTGEIIAILTRDQLIGEGELIFINLGEKSGIEVGNQLSVVRRGDAYAPATTPDTQVGQNDTRYPARSLGRIMIVEVGRDMSIALVTLSVMEMSIGDKVLLEKSRGAE